MKTLEMIKEIGLDFIPYLAWNILIMTSLLAWILALKVKQKTMKSSKSQNLEEMLIIDMKKKGIGQGIKFFLFYQILNFISLIWPRII